MTVFCRPCGKLVDTMPDDGVWRYPQHSKLDNTPCPMSGEEFTPPWMADR